MSVPYIKTRNYVAIQNIQNVNRHHIDFIHSPYNTPIFIISYRKKLFLLYSGIHAKEVNSLRRTVVFGTDCF